jgi:hypothetical protein
MTKYDSEHHSPPAPVAWVTVENPSSGTKLPGVPMLIDSGADVTLLPELVVKQLGLQLDMERGFELADFENKTTSIAHPALATVNIGKLRFKGLYLFRSGEIGILGRNILNAVVLELNGPKLEWHMQGY